MTRNLRSALAALVAVGLASAAVWTHAVETEKGNIRWENLGPPQGTWPRECRARRQRDNWVTSSVMRSTNP